MLRILTNKIIAMVFAPLTLWKHLKIHDQLLHTLKHLLKYLNFASNGALLNFSFRFSSLEMFGAMLKRNYAPI